MMNKDEKSVAAILCCLLGMAVIQIAAAAAAAAASLRVSNARSTLTLRPDGLEMPACNGTIGKCEAADQSEFLMESEISRRFLQDGKSIGYGSLDPDRPVCRPGQGRSYGGNCLPPRTNPPSRGCNNYYSRCRTGGG